MADLLGYPEKIDWGLASETITRAPMLETIDGILDRLAPARLDGIEFRTAQDFASSMKKIRDIGYTTVQVSGIGPIPDAQVKAIVTDAGLSICNTHVSSPL